MNTETLRRAVVATPVRWGILSTARINQHAMPAAARESQHASVVAVAARDRARAQAYAHDHDIPRAFGSYCVSGARLIGGEPVRVHGTAVLGPTRADLAFVGTGHLLSSFPRPGSMQVVYADRERRRG